MDQFTPTKPLDRYLSKLDVWGMAFGCMVGWGVFAMPGTTVLPIAGPLGTFISMGIGMLVMLIIGIFFLILGIIAFVATVYREYGGFDGFWEEIMNDSSRRSK